LVGGTYPAANVLRKALEHDSSKVRWRSAHITDEDAALDACPPDVAGAIVWPAWFRSPGHA
jgi:hypothetical protein